MIELILEIGVDYIQKSYYTQSQGVSLCMIQQLEKIVKIYEDDFSAKDKNNKKGLKELSDFWRLYGQITGRNEYIE